MTKTDSPNNKTSDDIDETERCPAPWGHVTLEGATQRLSRSERMD